MNLGGTLTPTGGMIQQECAKKEQPEREKKKRKSEVTGARGLKCQMLLRRLRRRRLESCLCFWNGRHPWPWQELCWQHIVK